jgi:putative spermidine/putrescine transport system permease protein
MSATAVARLRTRPGSKIVRSIWLPSILLFGCLVVIGLPILMAVAWSLVDPDHPWSYPDPFPPSLSLYQWSYVFRFTDIVRAIATSYGLATTSTLVAFVISLPTAYAIGRYEFRGKDAIRILLLLPLVLPGLVVALFLSRVFGFIGLAQTFPGLVLGHTLLAMPYMARLLSTSFEAIPRDISDAASNLGASELKKFREVYLPMIMPGILAGAILTFVASLEEFALTYVIGTPDYQTIPTVLFGFLGQHFIRTNAAVVALILLVPNIILLFIADRALRADFVASAYAKL